MAQFVQLIIVFGYFQRQEFTVSSVAIPSEKLADLIKVLQSGIRFYKEGIKAVKCDDTREMFTRILTEKEQACAELRRHCSGVKDTGSNFIVDARNVYTRLISRVTSHSDQMFTEQLASMERRVLHYFDDVLKEQLPQHIAQLLRKIRTRLLQCYDELQLIRTARKKFIRNQA